MRAQLIAIAGPLKSLSRELKGEEVSIGRDSSNHISISDVAVSRRHCAIRREQDNYRIVDLDSLNGTFVNGVPVKERLLHHGDRIEIADSSFVFAQDSGEMVEQPAIKWNDEAPPSTLELAGEESLRNSRAEHVSLLFRLSEIIYTNRQLDDFQKALFKLIAEALPCQRGAVILSDVELSQASAFHWSRRNLPPLVVSRTIARKAMQKHIGILANNIGEQNSFAKTESLMKSGSCSVICVPLETSEKSFGILYLDSNDPSVALTEDHLQLVQSIARIAAAALENLQHFSGIEKENQRLRAESRIEHELVGGSMQIQEVLRFIEKAAPTDSTVLISGESGTGKELVARAIHRNCPRNNKAFVAINCATLTDTLLESELFGHEKGAFTGAIAQKKGKFEIADGGTIFLDEIAELTSALQAKLLRVLQEREIERIGGIKPIRIDVRVIAATNRDLKQAVKEGSFRSDLYYRLNVVAITVPPLRERMEDVSMLANYFASRHTAKSARKIKGFAPEARALLTQYHWPGNVRELENAVERAIVLGSSEWILPEDLPESVLESEPAAGSGVAGKYHEALRQMKKDLILKALSQSRGNYTEAAKLLGIHPNYLHRLIRNLSLKSQIQ